MLLDISKALCYQKSMVLQTDAKKALEIPNFFAKEQFDLHRDFYTIGTQAKTTQSVYRTKNHKTVCCNNHVIVLNKCPTCYKPFLCESCRFLMVEIPNLKANSPTLFDLLITGDYSPCFPGAPLHPVGQCQTDTPCCDAIQSSALAFLALM